MKYYCIGIKGSGMSTLANILHDLGNRVSGYDDSRHYKFTEEGLNKRGIEIYYEPHDIDSDTIVTFSRAFSLDHPEIKRVRELGLKIMDYNEVVGEVTGMFQTISVCGTHGKTTTSTMAAHLIYQSHVGTAAFLGGISKNYGTNLLTADAGSDLVVIEADEFDRSFHWLEPFMTVITSADPDHLDIYGTAEAYRESFEKYITLIRRGGTLILHEGLQIHPTIPKGVSVYTYSRDHGDFHAENIRIADGEINLDFVSPQGIIHDIQLGVPIPINIDNGVAAMALAQLNGVTDEEIRRGMASFKGVERRFDFKIKNEHHVFLSDYAHHPAEIRQSALSIRELYKNRHITALFQPHLYSRTRDFYREFAESLSLLDEVILVDIYPAREEPIPGVTTKLIYDLLAPGVKKMMISKEQILPLIQNKKEDLDVLISLGAGDIEDFVPRITEILEE